MYRIKQLFSVLLTLRDYDGQVAEALAMEHALNKMTKTGMSEACELPESQTGCRETHPKSDLFNKPVNRLVWLYKDEVILIVYSLK